MSRRLVRISSVGLALLLACACSEGGKGDKADAGQDARDGAIGEDGSGGHDAGATGNGGVSGRDAALTGDAGTFPFPVNPAGQVLCGSAPCACSNGIDDDADGLTDLEDPECVSSWDNDEGSFATGIPGDNRDDACQDCFFDGNSGSGDDGCYQPTSCLTQGDNSSGRGRCNSCEQTDKCRKSCRSLTPNGCDCFGCCGVRLENGTVVNLALSAGCNIDGNTTDGCTTCVQNNTCKNECGKCELCPGKTLKDLPAECFETVDDSDASVPPPAYTCDDGEPLCGKGLPACESGYACEFGCCVRLPAVVY